MKFAVAAILIVAAFAEEKKKPKVEPLIEASTRDTLNDCLFLDRTNQGAIPRTPHTCFGMYFNMCDQF